MNTKVRKPGKTQKDRENNTAARNAANKAARAVWDKDSHRSNKTFPLDSCNGKKSKALKA